MKVSPRGILYIISSVAGGGKSTLISLLLKKYPDIHFSISVTSRPVRPGDEPGVNYHFVSREEFQKLIGQNFFLEWALVHDNYYGTSKRYIEKEIRKGHKVILDIDVQGFRIIKSKISNMKSIFILPPSEEIWIERLKKRGSDSPESIEKRIRNGKKELTLVNEYDFQIVNDKLDDSLLALEKILFGDNIPLPQDNPNQNE
ncbi:MAG: guanylate kinase [Leptospiraceae bacterium]|nr:guanylate kinase [Leptospiraceae bacterium]